MKYSFISSILFGLVLSGCTNISTFDPTTGNGGMRVGKSFKTWKDILQQNIVMQQFDYSCGAASIATLMRYYFQDEITEKEVLEDITSKLNKAEIQNRKIEGFSLLDLKKFAVRRGYQAVGVKLKLSALPKLRGPVLVFLNIKDYKHFAILRGVKGEGVFLADPSRGNVRMSVEEFAQEWNGETLVLGKKGFGTAAEYPLQIREDELFSPKRMGARKILHIR